MLLMEKDFGKILEQRRHMGANRGALAQMSKQGKAVLPQGMATHTRAFSHPDGRRH